MMRTPRRAIVALVLAVGTLHADVRDPKRLRPHEPIKIVTDETLEALAKTPGSGVTGGPGGDAAHPFVIEDLRIAHDKTPGIEISHTTAHLVIRNVATEGVVRRGRPSRGQGLSLVHAENVAWKECTQTVLVDTQPGTGNNRCPDDRRPAAVLDHHPGRVPKRRPLFRDVRPSIGATSTIVSEYLEAEGVEVDEKAATALVYAIETETYRPGEVMSDEDVHQYMRLFPIADHGRLSRIRNATLPREHFGVFLRALRDSFIYGDVIFSQLGEVAQPDIVAEIADFLVRFDRVQWAFVSAVHNRKLVISARSVTRQSVAKLLRRAIGRLGSAGGHEGFAGAQIALETGSQTEAEKIMTRIREKILGILDIRQERGERLVARKEILAKMI